MPIIRPTPSPGDARDIRILYWCYVVMAVLTLVFGAWLYFQLEAMIAQAEQRLLGMGLVDPEEWMYVRQDPENDPVRTTLWLMQIAVIVLTPVHAMVYVLAAWYLHRLRGYWTLVVIAILNMLAAPVGTVVSIFHLVVFIRPSVRGLFGK